MDRDTGERPLISVAARQLAETVRRRGGLMAPLYAGITGLEGSRIHRDFQERAPRLFAGSLVLTEISLKEIFQDPTLPFDLQVQGRSDLVILSPQGRLLLIEIKGFRGQAESLPPDGDPAHLAQAALYAHMILQSDLAFFQESERREVDLEVRYLPLDGGPPLRIEKTWTREDLEAEFRSLCLSYGRALTPLFLHRQKRNKANRAASFPYQDLREGQKTMMEEVIAAIRDKEVLIAQAPTGIGKTMATLYPALKAQANGMTDQILYLTPTRSQREVAEKSLDDLEAQGFTIRSLTLQAKEESCLAPEYFCDMRVCPYAVSFFDRINDALAESYRTRRLLPGHVRDLARKHGVCPFELAMALIPGLDCLICDYNYVFNPRVRLKALDEDGSSYTLLVDEAHNLARRSREMFSAVLSRSGLKKLRDGLPRPRPGVMEDRNLKAAVQCLDRLLVSIDSFGRLLEGKMDKEEEERFLERIKDCRPARDEGFLATRLPPAWLMDDLASLTGLLTRFFLDQPDFPGRQVLMTPYFDLVFFQKVATEYYDEGYICSWRMSEKGDVFMTLLALDASRQLTQIYRGRSPVVFFSATLSPLPYYMSLLDARPAGQRGQSIRLPSPFPSERRLVMAFEAHSIRYKDRNRSLDSIARLLQDLALLRKGHYLVFSPSFAYQRLLVKTLAALKDDRVDYLVQPSGMTGAQKDRYLDYFRQGGRDKSLLGLTVMGSLFNEGIDLTGEALTGVVIIGTGLPGLSAERNILRQYYEGKTGQGYEYAYVWPGFNRVTQAVGRLIRGEEDYGFALLIDDRYGRQGYRQLLPDEWKVHHLEDPQELLGLLSDFWKNFD